MKLKGWYLWGLKYVTKFKFSEFPDLHHYDFHSDSSSDFLLLLVNVQINGTRPKFRDNAERNTWSIPRVFR